MAKTALELSPHEWQKYRPQDAAARHQWQHDEVVITRWQAAQKLAKQAAQLLQTEFDAQKVFLFGSAVRSTLFSPWSDVDLAVEGIPPERFYAAVAAITGLSATFRVDLIDLATCKPHLRQEIEQHGIAL